MQISAHEKEKKKRTKMQLSFVGGTMRVTQRRCWLTGVFGIHQQALISKLCHKINEHKATMSINRQKNKTDKSLKCDYFAKECITYKYEYSPGISCQFSSCLPHLMSISISTIYQSSRTTNAVTAVLVQCVEYHLLCYGSNHTYFGS